MTITRVIPAGVGIGEKLTSAEVNGIDQALTYAADKRTGQSDTIASAWSLMGSIIGSANGAVIGANASGAIIEASAAGAKIRTRAGGRFELGDNDYPGLAVGHAGRSVSRLAAGLRTAGLFGTSISDSNLDATHEESTPGVGTFVHQQNGTVFNAVFPSESSGLQYVLTVGVDDALVQNATIASVDVFFRPASAHSGVPAYLPKARVVRAAVGAVNFTKLHTPDSYAIPTPANVAAYEVDYTLNVPCSTANVVDRSQYAYFLQFFNENGANALAGLIITGVRVNMTVTEIRP